MNENAGDGAAIDNAVAAYKRLLKAYLDLRPSGTRQRIAGELGTHKSFVSQITNPNYRVPVPAQHVAAIMRICHFSPEERRTFLEAYRNAHPGLQPFEWDAGDGDATHLRIVVPEFRNPRRRQVVVDAIQELADRIIALARLDDDRT